VFVVDTNILVHAANLGSPFHASARQQVEKWRARRSVWYITWGIVYEFMRVTTHRRVLTHPWTVGESWAFIQALLASPGLSVLQPTDRHASVVTKVLVELPHVSGNLVHDATTAILMREHGIKMVYTQDTDFHRFPFLEPTDPLT
jgi:uncharacterized protein